MRLAMRMGAYLFSSAVAAVSGYAEDLVYRVDSAAAVIVGKHMIVTAKGAVQTGGWEHPRLVVQKKETERGDVEIAFVAAPPEDPAVVVHSLVPIRVKLKTDLPKSGVAAVRILSKTNEVTAEIIPKSDGAHTASH